MIPLAHWLSSDSPAHPQSGVRLPVPDDRSGFNHGDWADELEARLADMREQARCEFSLEAAAMVAEARQEERRNFESREAMIVAKWSAHCAEVTGTALANLLQELYGLIGNALTDVLRPFLPGALHQQAIADLLELLRREFSVLGREVIEVRAPLETHEKLRTILDGLSIRVVLTESERIEVLSGNGVGRFEQLAVAWAEMILPDGP